MFLWALTPQSDQITCPKSPIYFIFLIVCMCCVFNFQEPVLFVDFFFVFFFCFVWGFVVVVVYVFETGFLCITALVVLELTL